MAWYPFSKSIKHNPFPFYAASLEQSSIQRSISNLVFALGYDEVKSVLSDSSVYLSPLSQVHQNVQMASYQRVIKYFLFFLNHTEHRQFKQTCGRAFTLDGIQQLISTEIHTLLQTIEINESFDFITQFAEPLTANILCNLLGVPTSDKNLVLRWGRLLEPVIDIFLGTNTFEKLEEASQEIEVYFNNLIEQDFDKKNCFIKNLKSAYGNHLKPQDKELITSLSALIIATTLGTTIASLGNACYTLLSNRYKAAEISKQNIALNLAVEELLRFEPPVHFVFRVLGEDTALSGAQLNKGQLISVCLASANRDPAHFEQPHELIWNRKPNPHLSFGAGSHFCMGAGLAKMVLTTFLEAFLPMIPNLQLDDSQSFRYISSNVIKGFEHLQIKSI